MSQSQVSRRMFMGLGSAAMAAAATGEFAHATPALDQAGADPLRHATPKTNLVIFMPDELRADALACYGNPVCKTPNFDTLAKQGTRFANTHVQFPVCGASRCSMLTGWNTSVRGHRSLYYFLRPEEPNLFRYLKQAGYDVFWYGKNDALAAQCFYDSVTEWSEKGNLQVPGLFGRPGIGPTGETPGSYSFLFPPIDDRKKTIDYSLLRAAMDILERKETERPFCLFIPVLQPHAPYSAPADFHNLYNASDVDVVPAGLPKKPNFHAEMRSSYGLDKLSTATLRKIKATYYGQVSYTDWLLGELLEALERTHHSKDTTVITLSDHGDYAGDYGLVEKWPSGLEDCLTHVPMIIRTPGGAEGHTVEEVNELYDMMQTCIDLASTHTNHTHFARSLVPQLMGAKGDPERCAFAEGGYNVYEPQCYEPADFNVGPYKKKVELQNQKPETVCRSSMVRTASHKLILRANGEHELYHNAKDPGEQKNLYNDAGVRAVQAELEHKLAMHFMNTTGVAPKDKDERACPPFITSRKAEVDPQWPREWLDRS